MNNTRILAIVAVLTAATLVVGLTVAATMTPSAFAGGGKKDGQDKYMGGVQGNGGKDNGSGNGNTKTIQVLKQNAKSSAFTDGYKKDGHDKYVKGKPANDSSVVVQNGQNSICTHPSETCTSQSNQPLEVP
ncbi:MAG TPA: hypothetical protein VE076_11910 [Nitrososphaeraceae archaeon]|nr:hypothetical protein [Nitrososphaeraceae archaeon]